MNRVRKFMSAALVLALAGGIAIDGAEARKKKQAPPPPPPAPLVPIPQRPYVPNYAAPNLPVPPVGADGLFESPNRKISTAQITWNLRSAYNVGALNCPEPARTEITNGYRAFLRTHARGLTAANRAVDSQFRQRYGARFVASREAYMTGVYNHFAMPVTLDAFCNAVLAVSRDGKLIKPTELDAFTARALPSIEIVFDDFYRRYAQWKLDIAAWDTQYYDMYVQRYGSAPYGPPKTVVLAAVTPVPAPAGAVSGPAATAPAPASQPAAPVRH